MTNDIATIILFRHGALDNPDKVLYGRTVDLHLSELGKNQVKETSEKIRQLNLSPHKIYTSPLSRTVETAQIISEVLGIRNISKDEHLVEVDIPTFAGKPEQMLIELMAKGITIYDKEFIDQGSESIEHVADRMLAIIATIAKENKGKTTIAVSHGDPLRILLYRLTNPKASFPSIIELNDSMYPPVGSCFIIKVTTGGELQYLSKLL